MKASLTEPEMSLAAGTVATQGKVDRASTIATDGLLQDVGKFVNGLPAEQRIALILHKYHGLEYGEIAAKLNISESAARQNVYQAYRKLREQLADRR